jgi:NADPH:quinone reductase
MAEPAPHLVGPIDGSATAMSCVVFKGGGGIEVIGMDTRPCPRPAPGEILIEVVAAGINRPDLLQRQGKYPPPPGAPDVPGLEVAGYVAALGEGVTGWWLGERVCALLAGGGYATYAVAPAGQCLPVPDDLSLIQAAALPETLFTVWSNVFDRGRLVAGESILIHGGTSGIGTTAIALCRAMGASVLTTAGSDEKCARCIELGADRAINYRRHDFVTEVKDFTNGRGVDVVLDMVGGPYIPRNIEVLAEDGRLVQIAFLGGVEALVNFAPVMRRRLTITGSTLRPRSVTFKSAIATALQDRVWPMLADGRFKPVIHATFPLSATAEAHKLMESGTHVGKIILTMQDEAA